MIHGLSLFEYGFEFAEKINYEISDFCQILRLCPSEENFNINFDYFLLYPAGIGKKIMSYGLQKAIQYLSQSYIILKKSCHVGLLATPT
jgi:hypothetical protein